MKSLFWEITPELYKVHLIGFAIGIIFIWFTFLQVKVFFQWYWDILVILGIFLIEWIIISLSNCIYISKLKNIVEGEIDNG